MRTLRVALLLGVVALNGCLCARPNPRVTRIDAHTPDGTGSAAFTYDRDAHLVKVEKTLDDGETVLLELRWADGHVSEIRRAEGEGALAEDGATLTLHHEGDLVVLAEGADTSTTFQYDEQDRLVATNQDRTSNAGAVITNGFTYTYDDDGALSQIAIEQASGDVSLTAEYQFARDGEDRLERLSAQFDTGSATLDAAYDDTGALAKLIANDVYDDNPAANERTTTTYEYGDDGLLASARTVRVRGDGDDVTEEELNVDLAYDDGEAQGVDVTSVVLFPLLLWDMRGASHAAYDSRTQPARFVMDSW